MENTDVPGDDGYAEICCCCAAAAIPASTGPAAKAHASNGVRNNALRTRLRTSRIETDRVLAPCTRGPTHCAPACGSSPALGGPNGDPEGAPNAGGNQ